MRVRAQRQDALKGLMVLSSSQEDNSILDGWRRARRQRRRTRPRKKQGRLRGFCWKMGFDGRAENPSQKGQAIAAGRFFDRQIFPHAVIDRYDAVLGCRVLRLGGAGNEGAGSPAVSFKPRNMKTEMQVTLSRMRMQQRRKGLQNNQQKRQN